MDLLDGMRAFVAVAEAGSFTAAGERLGISKKLASKYVAELEVRLGLRLLNRTTRASSLTDSGSRYLAGCVDLLARLETLENGLREDDSSLRGTLRVAAPLMFGELHVAPLVANFRQENPELKVELQLGDRYVDIAGEGIDVAIRIGNLQDSTLIAKKLTTASLWTVAAPDYLRDHDAPAVPLDLARHHCIRDGNLRNGPGWPYRVDGRRTRVAVNDGLLVNSARTIRDLAVDAYGIALSPSYVVADDVREGRLVRLLREFEDAPLDVCAVYPSARGLASKVRAFIRCVEQAKLSRSNDG